MIRKSSAFVLLFLVAVSSSTRAEGDPVGIKNSPDGIACLNYAHSYMWPYDRGIDSVRILIDSRIVIYDDAAGSATVYYLGASCKSEDTFGVNKDYSEEGFKPGAKTLFYDPNYNFSWIFGDRGAIVFRRLLSGKGYRDVIRDTTIKWGESRYQLMAAPNAYKIPTDEFEPAVQATYAGDQLVGQTEISNSETGLRAVIEYPVKTMNVSRDGYPPGRNESIWQLDTGPIGVPDLSKRYDPAVGCFSLGFIATINLHAHAADFVLEQPTPLAAPNEHVKVLHYSNPYSVPAKNRLFGIPRPKP